MKELTAPRRKGMTLRANTQALLERRTMHQGLVQSPLEASSVLKPGAYNTKVGGRVTKGEWKGMSIWTLTLEERKTCNPHCPNMARCYGNNMRWAARIDHTHPAFIPTLSRELYALNARKTKGFVVRLHVLGDFFSTEYIRFWQRQLATFPKLRIYGYSAWPKDSEIGKMLLNLRTLYPARFRLRFSNQGEANVIPHPIEARGRSQWGLVCPAQTHKGVTCATCSLCWELPPTDPIAFMEH